MEIGDLNTLKGLSHEEQIAAIARYDSLPETFRELIWDDLSRLAVKSKDGLYPFILRIAAYCDRFAPCQSPIEQMMFFALERVLQTSATRITPQAPIPTQEKTYKADLLIDLAAEGLMPVIVECDGHEFHEKTKEQAQYDKERQRNLQIAGYHVIRFTGSEIFKDPFACAEQVGAYIDRITK